MSTLREHFDTSDTTVSSVYGAGFVGQSFTATSSYTITKTRIWADRQGSGSYTFTVCLYLADVNDFPTGSILASGTQDISGWDTGSGAEYTFTFTTPYNVTNGTKYVIVSKCPDAPVANRPRVYGSTTGGYAGGFFVDSADSGANWTAYTSYDLYFQNYGDDITTNIKSFNGLAKASIKSVNNLAIASVKNINNLA